MVFPELHPAPTSPRLPKAAQRSRLRFPLRFHANLRPCDPKQTKSTIRELSSLSPARGHISCGRTHTISAPCATGPHAPGGSARGPATEPRGTARGRPSADAGEPCSARVHRLLHGAGVLGDGPGERLFESARLHAVSAQHELQMTQQFTARIGAIRSAVSVKTPAFHVPTSRSERSSGDARRGFCVPSGHVSARGGQPLAWPAGHRVRRCSYRETSAAQITPTRSGD